MKIRRQQVFRLLPLAAALTMMAPAAALAATAVTTPLGYTPACTKIDNNATVTYKVNNVDPTGGTGVTTLIPATFYVGVKVDVSVERVDATPVLVFPGSTQQVVTFKVINMGNAAMKYGLTSAALATGTASPWVASSLKDTFDEKSGTIKTYGTDGTAATIASLAPDYYETVTIAVDIPNNPQGQDNSGSTTNISYVDNALAVYSLKAKSQWIGTSADAFDGTNKSGTIAGGTVGGGACTAPGVTNVDYVIADGTGSDDGDRDGAYSARDGYKVKSAQISISKSSQVLADPINCPTGVGSCGSNTARMIPGATVEYSITIANSASAGASATLNTISDTLNSSLNIVSTAAAGSWSVTGSTRTTASGTLTADSGDTNNDGLGYTGAVVAADLTKILAQDGVTYGAGELKSGESATVKFRVTIQ